MAENSPIYDVFFVGHAYQNDKGEPKTNWVEAGTGFPTSDGTGINIVWETTLPEEATEVVINAKGDTVHRILPVRVCVKRRVPKPATAKKAKSSKKKVDNVPFA